jgi:hypothetical protein
MQHQTNANTFAKIMLAHPKSTAYMTGQNQLTKNAAFICHEKQTS